MNFLVKKSWLLIILGAYFFSSCKESSEILLDPGDQANKIGTSFDTVTVHSSTVLLDSFSTSSEITGAQDFILFGKYNDPDLGAVEAKSFIEVGLPSRTIPTNATLVSFKLHLDIDYIAGEKSSQNISVYKLLNSLDSATMSERKYLYYSDADYSGEKLNVGASVNPNNPSGIVSLDLDPTLGTEFFNGLVNKSDNFTNQKKFKAYFPGLAILGEENSSSILGSSRDSSKIVLKYRVDTVITDVEFKLSNPYHFNNISVSNRNALANNSEKSFVQSSTGIITKISFPNVVKFKDYGKRIALNKVELIIEPEKNDLISPPSNFFLVHDLTSTFSVQNSVFPEAQRNDVNALNVTYNKEKNIYSKDITSYIEAILQNVKKNDGGETFPSELFLYPDITGNRINKKYTLRVNSDNSLTTAKDLTVNKAAIRKENIKIKVYYTIVAEF